jgi:hypothetical protein
VGENGKLVVNVMGRDIVEDLCVDGRAILIWFL